MSDNTIKPIEIFTEIDKLPFLKEKFMVVGSGILAVKGIRDTYDLDILVSRDIFDEELKSGKWEIKPWTWKGDTTKYWLKKDKVELMPELRFNGENVDLEFMKKDGVKINGIWFLSLEQCLSIKKRSKGPKDENDIVLIEEFLNTIRE